MADTEALYTALRNADAAGDKAAATKLAEYIRTQAAPAPTAAPAGPPLTGFAAVPQDPRAAIPPGAPREGLAKIPSGADVPQWLDSAAAGAMGVPALGLAAGGANALLRGSRAAPYAARAAEALIPESGAALAKLGVLGGVSGVAGEGARHIAAERGAGETGQAFAQAAGSVLPSAGVVAGRGASALAGKGMQLIDQARGAPAARGAGFLRSDVGEQLAPALQGAEGRQTGAERALTATGDAQTALAGREKVADARVRERTQAVKTALDKVAPASATLPEDVGSTIQSLGRENIKKLSSQRSTEAIDKIKTPAFKEAPAREAKGDTIATNAKSKPLLDEALKDLDAQIEGTTEPYRSQLKARLQSLRGEEAPMSEGERRAAALRASVTGEPAKDTKTLPLTLEQAEFMRRKLTDVNPMDTEGFSALDAVRRGKIADKLRAAMIAYEPRVGQYLEKYRELSTPISKATAGRGAALTEADLMAEGETLFAADKTAATNYFLNGSGERAERLLALAGGKKPDLVNAVKSHVRQQLDGMSAEQMRKFAKSNEGMLRVFNEVRTPLNDAIAAQSRLEELTAAATKKAARDETRLGGQARSAEQDARGANTTAERYRMQANKLETASIERLPGAARTLVTQLRKDGAIDDRTHQMLLRQIADVERRMTSKTEAAAKIKSLLRSAAAATGLGATGYYGAKALTSDPQGGK